MAPFLHTRRPASGPARARCGRGRRTRAETGFARACRAVPPRVKRVSPSPRLAPRNYTVLDTAGYHAERSKLYASFRLRLRHLRSLSFLLLFALRQRLHRRHIQLAQAGVEGGDWPVAQLAQTGKLCLHARGEVREHFARLACGRRVGAGDHADQIGQLGVQLDGVIQRIGAVLRLDLDQHLFDGGELLGDGLGRVRHRLLLWGAFHAPLPVGELAPQLADGVDGLLGLGEAVADLDQEGELLAQLLIRRRNARVFADVELAGEALIAHAQLRRVAPRRGGGAGHVVLGRDVALDLDRVGIAHVPDEAVRSRLLGQARLFLLLLLRLVGLRARGARGGGLLLVFLLLAGEALDYVPAF